MTYLVFESAERPATQRIRAFVRPGDCLLLRGRGWRWHRSIHGDWRAHTQHGDEAGQDAGDAWAEVRAGIFMGVVRIWLAII